MAHAHSEAMFKGFCDTDSHIDDYGHEFTAKAYENGRLLAVLLKTVLKQDCDHITVDNVTQHYNAHKREI